MNVLDAILNAQGGGAVQEAARSVGLSQEQTASALSALVPALAAGLQRNAAQPGGLQALMGALSSGQHGRYVDDVSTLGQPNTVQEGNAILEHVLGSKDVSRAVAARAAAQTGIGADALKRLLPIAATLVMASLSKQQSGARAPSGAALAGGGGLLSMLTPLLDQNKDGSVLDDIIGQAGRFFGGR